MANRKIALFGGTFDPVHLGHTKIASYAAEKIGAEKTIFIPAKRSPLKVLSPAASASDRFEMIKLAIAGRSGFEVSDYELSKEGNNYTIETVRYFKEECGKNAEIYWLMGADTIDEFVRWHRVVELIDECNLCAMYRAGCEKPNFTRFENVWGAERVKKLQANIIETPMINISSSEIRRRLKAGEDVSDMVCSAVAEYIQKHGLYK
jgi:nicotinate-nucleotide adenylyltransferase